MEGSYRTAIANVNALQMLDLIDWVTDRYQAQWGHT